MDGVDYVIALVVYLPCMLQDKGGLACSEFGKFTNSQTKSGLDCVFLSGQREDKINVWPSGRAGWQRSEVSNRFEASKLWSDKLTLGSFRVGRQMGRKEPC